MLYGAVGHTIVVIRHKVNTSSSSILTYHGPPPVARLPRYRRTRDLSRKQQVRLHRVLSRPLHHRVIAPAVSFSAVCFGMGLLASSNVWIASALYGVIGATIGMTVANLFFFRWILRYRTARRGRRVALRDVMRPSDAHPSRVRRLWLQLIGVTSEDIATLPMLWRPDRAG